MKSASPRPATPPRRGAALLIVLGVLLVSVTAATILLSAAAGVHTQREMARGEALAFDLLHAAEAPIQHWLERESSEVVLPPDAVMPATTVLADRWERHQGEGGDGGESGEGGEGGKGGEGEPVSLVITAFDQLGMTPMHAARSGSPLRLALPAEVTAVLDQIDLPPPSDPTPLGLDLVREFAFDTSDSGVRIFPDAASDPRTEVAVGGLIATHNRDPVRININTAPMPLLEAALRAGGRGGLESILASRRAGKPATGEDAVARGTATTTDTRIAPRLVASSDCWSFRIDIEIGVGGPRRSWWAIYQPGPDDPQTSRHERWRCVQRLPVDE